MIHIERGKIDTFQVGDFSDITRVERNSLTFFFEIENKRIQTISVRDVKEMEVYGKVVTVATLDTITQEKPIIDGDFYIYPNLQLSLYIDFKNEIFAQVLVFDSSLVDLYVPKAYKLIGDSLLRSSNILELNPFKAVNQFVFNTTLEDFKKEYHITTMSVEGIGGKKIFESASLLFEFYNQLLCNIYVKTPHLFDKILVRDYNLNNDKDIKRLISTEEVLYHGHWIVIPTLGISIEGDNLTRLCFYNEYVAPFWENIRRPITSW